MEILQATNLSHQYGSFQALAPTDLSIHEGEIIIVEGPNGSGKTTLMLCLSGLIHPSSGDLRVCGHDIFSDEPEAMRCLAFSPDVPRFYMEMTAWEHMLFIARAHGMATGAESRAEKLMREFDLWGARHGLPHHFSRGMSLKLGLVLALIRPFKLLLLDEPFGALDARVRKDLRRWLRQLHDEIHVIKIQDHIEEGTRPPIQCKPHSRRGAIAADERLR